MTVSSFEQAEMISRAAEETGQEAEIFVAVDTGMHRIGFPVCENAAAEVRKLLELPYLKAGVTFSHFARADEEDLTLFRELVQAAVTLHFRGLLVLHHLHDGIPGHLLRCVGILSRDSVLF
jgi:alanine racemase